MNKGYDRSGKNNSFYGKHHTEETKKKISKIRIDKKLSEGKNNGMYGKTHTKQARAKISNARNGQKTSKDIIKKRTKTYKLNNPRKSVCITSQGYVCLYKPNHEFANTNGHILEHRYLISKTLNRKLDTKEQVHHKDLNKQNNNFILFENSSYHNKFHFLYL